MRSAAMQEIFGKVKASCVQGKGTFMVVHPKDSAEFIGFINQLCCRGLPMAPPRIMQREDTGRLFSLHESDTVNRGIVLLQAEALSEPLIPELGRLLYGMSPRILIARFANEKCLKRSMEIWSSTVLREKFDTSPIAWPSLLQRGDDLPGIMDCVCAALVTQDGTHRATLSPEARDVLLRDKHRHVDKLLARIRGAFDVALSEN